MSNLTAERELETELYRGTLDERLAALGKLCSQLGPRSQRGTNVHIHTSESFSVFRSPSEAVWRAAQENLAVLGINDHYTVAGHEEFRRACAVAGIDATFSMEAVAMDRDAAEAGIKLNDPDNPGRVYLCGKGITRVPAESSAEMQSLARMRAALERRNRELTAKVDKLFEDRLGANGPSWADVVALTPRGNATERHVASAVLRRLRELAEEKAKPLEELIAACCGATPPAPSNDAALQIFLRGKLLKAGAPCYVPEDAEAFVSVEELRRIFLAFGSIPTYPILGNPVLSGEQNIEQLLDNFERRGWHAAEVIPVRNTPARLREIVNACQRRWWPVFNGTEHNTPEMRPMLDPFALDPEFEPWFRRSIALLLGHQRSVAQGKPGFVDAEGRPTIRDAKARFEHFSGTVQ
ncbi:MAG TPA: PHP domain-containing protein [Bryobacteraceae bacterium]|nr:PHP domain-containing protein [Bryobacteraceae bacterium]